MKINKSLSMWICATTPWVASVAWADDPGAKVERPAYAPDASARTVEFWKQRIELDPAGAIAHRELAAALLRLHRETGAIEHAVAAEKAARAAIAKSHRGAASAWSRLASALLAQHRFTEALEAADQAVRLDPDAERLRADVLLELGRIDDAEKAIARLAPDAGDDPNRLALEARLHETRGRSDRAIEARKRAAELADALYDLPHETAAWYRTMVGHALIDSGRIDEGERDCLLALEIFPRDHRAVTGLAEVAVARGRWSEAREQASRALELSPENPEAMRILYEACGKLGDSEGAKAAAERFERLAKSFPRIHDRHWVLFCADRGVDLPAALELARKDLELRPDAQAHDTLAWVAFKAGSIDEAARAIARALELAPHDDAIRDHAAEIEAAARRPR
ncbi:MAG: tetratricopeptide repeat protein [Isosphaeraceae bacterium]|nr:tetratricopeptide repeat protein [Isosphaeraceae bacterium]